MVQPAGPNLITEQMRSRYKVGLRNDQVEPTPDRPQLRSTPDGCPTRPALSSSSCLIYLIWNYLYL